MTISHQTVLDEAGNPTAALIPWAEFELLRDHLRAETADEFELSHEWREELEKRVSEIDDSKVQLVDGEDFLSRIRAV